MDATEVARYAQALAYDPIVELNQDLEMVPVLAESVTTEDNQTFVVKLREEANWSDGEPVTADDVIFTVKKLTSRDLANPSMSTWYGVKALAMTASSMKTSKMSRVCTRKMTRQLFL